MSGPALLFVALTHGALACVVVLAHRGQRPVREGVRDPVAHGVPLFILLLAITLALFRWPVFTTPLELTPDESTAVVRAAAFGAGTGGSLVQLPITALLKMGYPLHWFSARLVALALLIATFLALHLGARRVWGVAAARLGSLPLLAFFAWAGHTGYLQYSDEHVVVALIALGAALLGYAGGARVYLVVASALCIAAGFAIMATELSDVAWATPPGGLTDEPGRIAYFLFEPQLMTLTLGAIALAVAALRLTEDRNRTLVRLLPGALITLAALVLAVALDEAQRRHALPIALGLGVLSLSATGELFASTDALAARLRAALPIAVLVVVGAASWLGSWRLASVPEQLFLTAVEVASTPPGEKLRGLVQPGEKMALWGYSSSYVIEAQATPATREDGAIALLLNSPDGERARGRFVDDVRQNDPVVILDSIAPGARAAQMWPRVAWPPVRAADHAEMKALLDERYELHLELRPPKTIQPLRLYLRKERAKGMNWLPTGP